MTNLGRLRIQKKEIMKHLYTFLLCLLSLAYAESQQLGYVSTFSETNPYWNPATTAPGNSLQADGFFRQQWAGFSGAPRTAYASVMMPIIDYNMSFGGIITLDQTGPIGKLGIKGNYAYKLNGVFTDDGILAFGVSAAVEQFRYNGSDEVFRDAGDVLVESGKATAFFPSVTAGIYLNTNPLEDGYSNPFYVGLAFQQAYATELTVGEAKLERVGHINFMIGTKIFSYDSYIEPSMRVNFVSPEILNYTLSAKYEMLDIFWAGLGYSSVSDVIVEGGYILSDFMGNRYAKLRLGAAANYSLTNRGSDLGPGFELLVSYVYELD